ncbi:hypothetical protein, partial [Mobiluncus mulieris]
TTFIPSSLETPTKNQEKINTFCPLSLETGSLNNQPVNNSCGQPQTPKTPSNVKSRFNLLL